MRRAFTVVATAVVAVGGFAGPASAATTLPLCTPNDGYIPGQTCEAAVLVTPQCVDGLPVLDYAVEPDAVGGGSTVDVTWTNLPGADVVLADQPLSVDDMAWPAGADATVTLVFATSPAETRVNVTADAACSASLVASAPETTGGSGVAAAAAAGVAAQSPSQSPSRVRSQSASAVLAETGSEALPLALGGGALIAGGAALVLARRNRHVGAHRA